MIDFTSALPSAVTVNGRVFYLHTDFKNWLKFDRILTEKGVGKITYGDLLNTVLSDEITPYVDEMEELLQGIFDFYSDTNPCPKSSGGSGEKALDYQIDSDYIFSAFMEQYGIDLCEVDMHWHKFLALLRGISDNTMLGKIMSYRGYKNSSKSYEVQMKELKYSWKLPTIYTEEEKEQIKEFDDYFS